MKNVLLFVISLAALAFGDELQAATTCRSCTTGTCPAPWSTLKGTCLNGEWLYQGPVSLSGSVNIGCPVRVAGDVNFAAGTTVSFSTCGKISVDGFNAPGGIQVSVNLANTALQIGSRYNYATFKTSNAFVSGVTVDNALLGSSFVIFNEMTSTQANVLFAAPGTPAPVTAPSTGTGPVTDPNFNANGDRIRVCSKYTCTNPSICNDPTGGSGTCDKTTGEWVLPNDISVSTATISCPLRIQGNFRATTSLTINGCARLVVSGVATLAGQTNTDLVPITFDLNEYGKPSVGEKITWLSAAGGIVGGVGGYSISNIWDPQNTVQVADQLCGNAYTLLFTAINAPAPPAICATTASAVTDDFIDQAVTDEFIDQAVADDFAAQAVNGDFAVGDSAADPNAAAAPELVPAYAYALIVLGVLILVALVVVQVQLVLHYRDRHAM
jgi:hypothetical protein